MKTLLCFLMLALCGPLVAQTAKIESSGEGDAKQWTFAGGVELPMNDILEVYAATRNIKIIYDSRKIGGTSKVAGKEITLTGKEIDLFVANALEEFRMALAFKGAGQYVVIPTAEAGTVAASVREEDLPNASDWLWVSVPFILQNAEPNAVRGTVQNLVSRQGGQVMPNKNVIVVVERADRLREVAKTIRALDEAAKLEVKGYDLPNGVESAAAIKALTALFGADNRDASFVAQEGTSRVLVRIRVALHPQVQQAINALK